MATANVGTGKSGSYLVDFSSADDLWRKLAEQPETPSQLPRLSRSAARPPEFPVEHSSHGTQAKIARVQAKSSGFVTEGGPRLLERMPQDPWKSSERRLWFIAGSLMALALATLTAFAVVSLGPHGATTTEAANAPTSPIPGLPELTAPAQPASAQVATAASTANTFRPPLPARVRAAESKPVVVARKHAKKHKLKKLAQN